MLKKPPPKPPRRPPSGTLLSNKIQDAVKKTVKKEIQLVFDYSATSSESLPSSWTSKLCLDDESFVCSEKSVSKAKFPSVLMLDDVGQLEKSFNTCEFGLTNICRNKLLKKSYHDNFKTDILSIEQTLRNSSKYFQDRSSELNTFKMASNEDASYFDSISSSKILHKRQNSDPLPSSFLSSDSRSFLPTSSTLKVYKPCGCEYACGSLESKFLLQEIKSLKEINHKLWEHLCRAQAGLEKCLNKSCDYSNTVSFSDLLLSLYSSLRAKDTAMENRMKLILLERDDAIQNLDDMVQTATRNFDIYTKGEDISSSEKEIKMLLKKIEVASEPAKLIQLQKLLLFHLYRSKELKLDCTLQEMQLMIIERDNLQLKVQLLENELSQFRSSSEICECDKRCWESSLLNTLCQTIQQRDTSLKYRDSLKSGYTNKISSLHEAEVNFQKTENAFIKKKPTSGKSLETSVRSDKLKCFEEKVFILEETFEEEKSEITESLRLNKLVEVLQKKLNGKNIGVLV